MADFFIMLEGQKPDWSKSHSEVAPKTLEEFKDEVMTKWGMDFDSIPKGTVDDLLNGPSLMAFGDLKIIGVGYPEKDEETGEEIYLAFRVVDISQVS